MDLHKLRVFEEVARCGSLTRAGESLHLSQPSVSVHIRDLERSAGVPLLERLGRGVRLTEPGRILVDYARRILSLEADARSAMASFRDGETGSVVVGASSTPGTYLLPALVAAFRKDHPGVKVELHILDTEAVASWLHDLTIDIGVTGGPVEGMESRSWVDDELVLVGRPDHPFARRRPSRVSALDGLPFVMRESGSSVRADTESWLSSQGITPEVVMTLDGAEAVKRSVAAGLGLSIASIHSIGTEVRAGDLTVLRAPGLPIRRRLQIVRNPRKPLMPAARTLLSSLDAVRRDTRAG